METMDLHTAVAILNQQAQEMMAVANVVLSQAGQASQLVNEQNSIPSPEAQIKSLMASMTIQMTALNAQDVIVQQYIDKISEILAATPISAS